MENKGVKEYKSLSTEPGPEETPAKAAPIVTRSPKCTDTGSAPFLGLSLHFNRSSMHWRGEKSNPGPF